MRTQSTTVARLTLESYLRSGWMWAEFVLVLVFFAALFFRFKKMYLIIMELQIGI